MKKIYEKPELQMEQFDTADVITTSSLDTVNSNMGNNGTPVTFEAIGLIEW